MSSLSKTACFYLIHQNAYLRIACSYYDVHLQWRCYRESLSEIKKLCIVDNSQNNEETKKYQMYKFINKILAIQVLYKTIYLLATYITLHTYVSLHKYIITYCMYACTYVYLSILAMLASKPICCKHLCMYAASLNWWCISQKGIVSILCSHNQHLAIEGTNWYFTINGIAQPVSIS